MARMRIIDEAITLIKQEDQNTALTKHALRKMVLAGDVPYIMVGARKRLINYDVLIATLNNLQAVSSEDKPKIRRILV